MPIIAELYLLSYICLVSYLVISQLVSRTAASVPSRPRTATCESQILYRIGPPGAASSLAPGIPQTHARAQTHYVNLDSKKTIKSKYMPNLG